MGDQTLIVHSGTFKTGSTSIQMFLDRNTERLASVGVLYPSSGRHESVKHTNLTAELKEWQAFTPSHGGLGEILDELETSSARVGIVSEESLSLLGPTEMQKIGRECERRGVAVTWIHYVREQADFLNAFYVERVMTMRPDFVDVIDRPFEEFRSWSPVPTDFLHYDEYVRSVLESIPGVDLRIRPYFRSELVGRDSVADFLCNADIPLQPQEVTMTNVTPGWPTVEIAKRLIHLLSDSPLSEVNPDDESPIVDRLRRMAKVRPALMRASDSVGWNQVSAMYCSAEDRRRIERDYRESNERLGGYCDFDLRELIGKMDPRPRNVGRLRDIPGDEVAEVLCQVLPIMMRRTP